MPCAGRHRSALRIAIIVGCLLLAVCVFAWGLHAKLSLYEAHVVPSAATVAKLLITQKTGRELIAPLAPLTLSGLRAFTLALLSVLMIPLLRILWFEPEMDRARATSAPFRRSLLSRPPPR